MADSEREDDLIAEQDYFSVKQDDKTGLEGNFDQILIN